MAGVRDEATGRRFEGQVAVVTGGVRGIGRGIAARLAAEGARVVLWDLDLSAFDAGAAGFEPALAQVVDVTDAGAVRDASDQVVRELGGIGVLVNNAGINGPVHPVWDYPLDAWDRVLRIDLTAVFLCCRAVLPHMLARGYGRIVNVASVAGKEGNAGICAYSAAKGGVIALTKSIAKDVAGTGVLVNCVAPSMVETELLAEMTPEYIAAVKAKVPMGRLLTIPELAATVAFAASSECSFTTGFTFDATGGRATY